MYVTVDEVRRAVTRSSSRQANTTGSLPDDQITDAIDNAQSEVDARLRGRYSVPFSPVPALVHSTTLDIAAYLATLNYRQEKELPDGDPVVRRYQRACALLKDIAAGNADLDAGDGAGPATRTGGGLGAPASRGDATRMWAMSDFGLADGFDGDSSDTW